MLLKSEKQRQREIVSAIIKHVTPWAGSKVQAVAWYLGERIPAFGGKTARELVEEGKGEAVLHHLDCVELGGFA